MKEIIVISGKGGTGKTSIAAALVYLAGNCVIADCDVDAADLHLLLKPDIKEKNDFVGGKKASINAERCIACNVCYDLCKFGAIKVEETYKVDPLSCEGCGLCYTFCPEGAIEFDEVLEGYWYKSKTSYGDMVHARLNPGAGNSGKLVSIIKNAAREIAKQSDKDLIIVDGSPGIGCPVISSITGADLVLVVTEPTVSGLHDLKRVLKLVDYFKISAVVCINKYDLNYDKAKEIEDYCSTLDIKIVGKIPYDDDFTKAQLEGKNIIEYSNAATSEKIKNMWVKIRE